MLPHHVRNAVEDALATLERKSARTDEMLIRRKAADGDEQATKQVAEWDAEDDAPAFPFFRVDGSEIETLEEVAAATGMPGRKTAALLTLETKGVSDKLRHAAVKEMSEPSPDDSIFIGLYPENPEALAMDGGVEPSDLHTTLFYTDNATLMGCTQVEFVELIRQMRLQQFTASANGQALFYDNVDSVTIPFVYNIDSPLLETFRVNLLKALEARQWFHAQTHGYTPHMTLAYVGRYAKTPALLRTPIDVTFNRLRISFRGNEVDMPLLDFSVPYSSKGIDANIELKVRHVRTPEGVARYKLPIGSPIVDHPDKPRIKRKTKTRRPKVTVSAIKNAANSFAEQLKKEKERRDYPNSIKTKRWNVAYTNINTYHDEVTFLAQDRTNGRIHKDWVSLGGRTPKDAIDTKLKRFEEQRGPLVKNNPAYMDTWQGIRGADWSYEEDNLPETLSLKQRKALAKQDSEELGLFLDQRGGELNINAHEHFNAAIRTYQGWWPSFGKIVDTFGVHHPQAPGGKMDNGFIAYNAHLPTGVVEGDKIYFNASLMGGDDAKIPTGKYRDPDSAGYYSVSTANVAEKVYGEVDAETKGLAMMMHTIQHEIGHTIYNNIIHTNLATAPRKKLTEDFLREFKALLHIDSAKGRDKEQTVSVYGTTSYSEMGAEIWAAYMLDDKTSELVKKAGALMDKYFSQVMAIEYGDDYQ